MKAFLTILRFVTLRAFFLGSGLGSAVLNMKILIDLEGVTGPMLWVRTLGHLTLAGFGLFLIAVELTKIFDVCRK